MGGRGLLATPAFEKKTSLSAIVLDRQTLHHKGFWSKVYALNRNRVVILSTAKDSFKSKVYLSFFQHKKEKYVLQNERFFNLIDLGFDSRVLNLLRMNDGTFLTGIRQLTDEKLRPAFAIIREDGHIEKGLISRACTPLPGNRRRIQFPFLCIGNPYEDYDNYTVLKNYVFWVNRKGEIEAKINMKPSVLNSALLGVDGGGICFYKKNQYILVSKNGLLATSQGKEKVIAWVYLLDVRKRRLKMIARITRDQVPRPDGDIIQSYLFRSPRVSCANEEIYISFYSRFSAKTGWFRRRHEFKIFLAKIDTKKNISSVYALPHALRGAELLGVQKNLFIFAVNKEIETGEQVTHIIKARLSFRNQGKQPLTNDSPSAHTRF